MQRKQTVDDQHFDKAYMGFPSFKKERVKYYNTRKNKRKQCIDKNHCVEES